MAARSNGAFLALRPPPPLPGAGWMVRVYAHTDLYAYARGRNPTPLAAIYRFQQLSLSPQVSDAGAGQITISLNDPMWNFPLSGGRPASAIRDYDNLFVVYEDGQWRGEFLGEKLAIVDHPAEENNGRSVTISGPGAAQVLAWAKVFSPYYPKLPPKNKVGVYQYANLPVMASWLQLLFAAQRRGTIPFVHCRFTATTDTGGQKWEDTPKAKPHNYDTQHLAGDVLFASGSAADSPAVQAAGAALAAKLADGTPRVTITGYTDDRESRDGVSSAAARRQLALDRANVVSNAIQAARATAAITCVGLGGAAPVASNATAAGRARNRRVRVQYQKNPAWQDSLYTPERGTDLLSLLGQLTSGQTTADQRGPIHCEWIMRKGFELQVRSQIGRDLSASVVYHEGSSYYASDQIDRDRTDIANLIAVQNQNDASYKVSVSPGSRRQWLQRELYVALTDKYSAAVEAQIARTQALASADQSDAHTVTVIPGQGRWPFRDYGVGDQIGLVRRHSGSSSVVQKQRVTAMTVTVDADGNAVYELTLQSAQARKLAWLQLQIDALTTAKKGIRTFIQDDQPTGALPGDLWTPATAATP
jgi:outer membrane protein OmpA-like peptidoglycan-associated protein